MRQFFISISVFIFAMCSGIIDVSAHKYNYSEQYPSINILEEYYISLSDVELLNNTPIISFYVDPKIVHHREDQYEMTIYSLFLADKQVRKEHFIYHANNDMYTDYSMVQYNSETKEVIQLSIC